MRIVGLTQYEILLMQLRLQTKKSQIQSDNWSHIRHYKIGKFYNLNTELKDLSASVRLQKRQKEIKSLVEDFFEWVKQ